MQKKISLSCTYKKKALSLRRILESVNMSEGTKKFLKVAISVAIAALTALAAGLGLSSCNVTRVVTNESQYLQRGDTSIVIHTRVTETYDASKK